MIIASGILAASRMALGAIPRRAWAWLGGFAVAGMLIWFAWQTAYNRGFSQADAAWAARVQEEQARQHDANDQALAAAREEVLRLNEANRVRDAHIERLQREIATLPDRPSVSPDGVRILNSIQ